MHECVYASGVKANTWQEILALDISLQIIFRKNLNMYSKAKKKTPIHCNCFSFYSHIFQQSHILVMSTVYLDVYGGIEKQLPNIKINTIFEKVHAKSTLLLYFSCFESFFFLPFILPHSSWKGFRFSLIVWFSVFQQSCCFNKIYIQCTIS